jgi:hypothetical protein
MNKSFNGDSKQTAFASPYSPKFLKHTSSLNSLSSSFRLGESAVRFADLAMKSSARSFGINPTFNINLEYSGSGGGGRKKVSQNMASKSNSNDGSNGSGNGSGRNGRDSKYGSNSRSGRFDQFPKRSSTSRIDYTTGIRSDFVINTRQLGNNEYSPCYILNGALFPAINESKSGSKDSYFMNILRSDIYENYLSLVYNRSGYQSRKHFTSSSFFDYTLTICNALEVFYCIDSILSYNENSHGRNYGLSILKDTLSAEVQSEFARLTDKLSNHCINPNIKNFISFMYQNFSFGETEDSAVIRLGYRRLLYPDPKSKSLADNMKASYIRQVSDSLSEFTDISNVYLRAVPEHVIDLTPSCEGILFNSEFCNFWHNCDIACFNSNVNAVEHSRQAKFISSRLRYGTLDAEPDGWSVALSSIFINQVTQPGIWKSNDIFTDLDDDSKTSLLALQDGQFKGCLEEELASGSGIYSVPVRNDYYSGVKLANFVIPGSKIVQSFDCEHAQVKAYSLIRILFDVSGIPLRSY